MKGARRFSDAAVVYSRVAKTIATNYAKDRNSAKSASKLIGKRNTKRIPIPPFRRPEAIFKQAVYKLAIDIYINRVTLTMADFVRERDEPYRHKPRNPTAVDWAIRLVDRAPRGKRTALGILNTDPLLDPTSASHLAVELNFAFRHEIDARFVSMFIEQVGGHEIISAKESDGGYSLENQDWVSHLQDQSLVQENQRLAAERAEDPRPVELRRKSRAQSDSKSAFKRTVTLDTVQPDEDDDDWN